MTARVQLHFLHFQWRQLGNFDKENAKRLKNVFETYCCQRDELDNYVSALVDRQKLDAAIEQYPNVSIESLQNENGATPPELIFPAGYRLACLHGQNLSETRSCRGCGDSGGASGGV